MAENLTKKRNVYISADVDDRLAGWLTSEGYGVFRIRTEGIVSEPVSNHPDMFMCRMGIDDSAELIICDQIANQLSDNPISYGPAGNTTGYKHLGKSYPEDIAYNAVCTGRYFIHNLRFTADELIKAADKSNMIKVNVKQGYAKCSTVIVDEKSVITYDQGLARACLKEGMEVLMVRPGYVVLPGYDSGFIGGASGRIGDTVVFHGDLSAHPDFEQISSFIEARKLRLKWFEEWPLTDIGSII